MKQRSNVRRLFAFVLRYYKLNFVVVFLFSATGHPFQQFAEMMSRSSVTSGSSLVWRRTDFRLLS